MPSTTARLRIALVKVTVPGFISASSPVLCFTWTERSPRKTWVFLSKIHSSR